MKLNQKRMLIWFLGIIAIVIVVSVVLQVLTPEHRVVTSIPTPIVSQEFTSNFQNVPIDIQSNIQTPETLPLLRTSPVLFSFNNLSQVFNTTVSVGDLVRQDKDGVVTISYEKYSHRFTYTTSAFGGGGDNDSSYYTEVNVDKAVLAAEHFLTSSLGISTLVPEKNNIMVGPKESENSESVASDNHVNSVASIPFSLQVNGYPVFSETDSFPLIIVHVDSNDVVISADFPEKFFTVTGQSQVKTVSLQKAVEAIKTTQPIIQSVQGNTEEELQLKNITHLTITDSSLSYHYFSSTNLIAPMYAVTAQVVQTTSQAPFTVKMLLYATAVQPSTN